MSQSIPMAMGRRRGRSSAGQDSSPVLSKPASLKDNSMRRMSSSSTAKRRTSFGAQFKEKPARSYAEEDGDLSDVEVLGPDGEVAAPKNKGKRGLSKDTYQCEICHKWYRHSACLIKHRWQHTDYWQQAAALQMSKHQTVMLLETAAILTNGSSLPEEKSLWPAAVSPPTSGLLGCETINTATLSGGYVNTATLSGGYGSFSSSLKSSLPTIPSKLNSQSGSTDSENATDPDNDMEDEEEASGSREEDMFVMEDMEMQALPESVEEETPLARAAPVHPIFKMQRSTLPHMSLHTQYSQSAPTLGFFAPRPSKHEAIILEEKQDASVHNHHAQFDTEMSY